MGVIGEASGEANRLRFSVQIPQARDLDDWVATLRFYEDHGFSSVSVPDHLSAFLPQWSPLVALGAAAAVTTRLRLAITVIDTDFHHPAILAKEVATLDFISKGRVDLGLGAGWLEADYVQTGIPWERPGVRIARLSESIDVLRPLLRGETVAHKGRFFTIDGFQATPTAVQQPVPILIGGGGRKVLTLAAQKADIVSIITNLGGPNAHRSGDTRRDAFEEQLGWIEEGIAASGRLQRPVLGARVLFGAVGDDHRALAQEIGAARGLTEDEVLTSPFMFIGSFARIEDHVHRLREQYGVSYFTLHQDMARSVAPLVAKLSGQ